MSPRKPGRALQASGRNERQSAPAIVAAPAAAGSVPKANSTVPTADKNANFTDAGTRCSQLSRSRYRLRIGLLRRDVRPIGRTHHSARPVSPYLASIEPEHPLELLHECELVGG